MSSIPMTIQGKNKLNEELKHLKTIERPKVIQEIATARAHGDLSENAEYDAAKEKQAFIEGRIKEIEDKLARAQVVDTTQIRTDKIVFGAIIQLKDLDSEEIKNYSIVGTDEADIKQGKISIESPVARQLLNKREGDSVTVRVPKGEIEYEILSVKYE
ncbi:MAG: transcription elongation factor GreA [Deltaproteobacteria bacterium]|nr:transcription elongation factor GreA [Deltaproteobacteria bacterium]MBM4315866.1 transcription elongation factor GreA [Deltaproteobacteria bacterium]